MDSVSPSNSSISLKILWNNDYLRVQYSPIFSPNSSEKKNIWSFSHLTTFLKGLLNGKNCCYSWSDETVKVSWKDEEGDWIRMSSNNEWSEALHYYFIKKPLTLQVKVETEKCNSESKICSAPSFSKQSVNNNKKETSSKPSNSTSSYKKISLPLSSMKSHYSVIVVGSGYGASILANRLSRANQQVCVLERGQEKGPGEYPNTLEQVLPEIQVTLPDGSVYGKRNMFYDFSIGEGTMVWRGCGLGGGSLVNSNVSIAPDPRLFIQDPWPLAFRQEDPSILKEGFARAYQVLCPTQYPNQTLAPLQKYERVEQVAESVGQGISYLAHVNVSFHDRVNDQGIYQPACTLCGDCNTGCNVGAKNTLIMNYLPDAVHFGAEIYCNILVESFDQSSDNGTYVIYCRNLDPTSSPSSFTITCDYLILGAGSLGSTEILLRTSQQNKSGMKFSSLLGSNFGADGDFFGFSYNNPSVVNSVGFGNNDPVSMTKKYGPVGPCISGVWDLRDSSQDVREGNILEDMSIPGALAPVVFSLLPLGSATIGEDTDPNQNLVQKYLRILSSFLEGPYNGASHNTLLFGGMGFDNQNGNMTLGIDGLKMQWLNPIDEIREAKVMKYVKEGVSVLQGTFIEDPFANPPLPELPQTAMCVHPLGGAIMGNSASDGVVNHKGQLFGLDSSIIKNVYVVDSAILPSSVGVNPLWTISALAERIAFYLAQDQGWKINYSSNPIALTHPSLLKW